MPAAESAEYICWVAEIDPAVLWNRPRRWGMTQREILFSVRFLRVAVILAGVRTARYHVGGGHNCRGDGSGGLGTFIFAACRGERFSLLLAGAIPAAAGNPADFLLGRLERRLRVT